MTILTTCGEPEGSREPGCWPTKYTIWLWAKSSLSLGWIFMFDGKPAQTWQPAGDHGVLWPAERSPTSRSRRIMLFTLAGIASTSVNICWDDWLISKKSQLKYLSNVRDGIIPPEMDQRGKKPRSYHGFLPATPIQAPKKHLGDHPLEPFNLKSRVPIFKRLYLSWVVWVDLPDIHLNEPEFNVFGYSFLVFPQRYTRWFILQPINLGPLPSGSLSKMAHWSRWFDDWPPKKWPLFFAKAQIIRVTPRCTGERTPSSARNSVTTCGPKRWVKPWHGLKKNGLISVTLW